jgi:hypothetical protein
VHYAILCYHSEEVDPPLAVDGPFAETKELIAGFWLWKVDSLQEAIDWVKRCPNPHYEDSEIEIRPAPRTARTGSAPSNWCRGAALELVSGRYNAGRIL